jgi:3-oxoacyl-[acyl-carrier-protein] synthase III
MMGAAVAGSPSAVIESIGIYLPSDARTTDQVLKGCRNPPAFPLEELTGITSRRVAAPDEFSIDLAAKAITACLARSAYGPEDVELLISCNISRLDEPEAVTFEPCTASRLKARFGMVNALAFDIANACAGIFTGLYLVDGLFKGHGVKVAIVVSGEYITHLTRSAQREIESIDDPRLACLTLGDAGAALLLESSTEPSRGFREIEMYTLGEYSNYCIAKASDRQNGGAIMLTDSLRLMPTAIHESSVQFSELRRRHGWTADDFQHVIMHQASKKSIFDGIREVNRICREEACPEEKVVFNVAERGNTASTTHAVALYDHMRAGNIEAGSNVLFSVNASGITVGTALYAMDDLPDRVRRADVHASPSRRRREAQDAKSPVARGLAARIAAVGVVPEWETTRRRSAVALAAAAAEECLDRAGCDRSDVDLLIYTGVYRDDFICEPAIAALVAGELGINSVSNRDHFGPRKTTLAFDVFNGAVGTLNACHLAAEMIRAGRSGLALVVAAEVDNNAEIPGKPAIGIEERGSAILLETSSGTTGFGLFVFNSFPSHACARQARAIQGEGGTFIDMRRSPDLDDAYIGCIARTFTETMERGGLQPDDVEIVLPPQISSSFIAQLRQRLALPRASFVDVSCGNADLYSSSLAYAFDALHQPATRDGQLAAFIGVGAGIEVGIGIYCMG